MCSGLVFSNYLLLGIIIRTFVKGIRILKQQLNGSRKACRALKARPKECRVPIMKRTGLRIKIKVTLEKFPLWKISHLYVLYKNPSRCSFQSCATFMNPRSNYI